jgi:hypothetical protein
MTVTTVAQPRCPDSPQQRAEAIRERNTHGLLLFNRERGRIHRLEGDVWTVPSSQGGFWRVDLAAESCPCPDFLYRCSDQDTGEAFMSCKHIIAAAIKRAKQPRASVAEDHPHACIDGWVTLHRYGPGHFALLARHRYGDPAALGLLAARMNWRREHAGEDLDTTRPLR